MENNWENFVKSQAKYISPRISNLPQEQINTCEEYKQIISSFKSPHKKTATSKNTISKGQNKESTYYKFANLEKSNTLQPKDNQEKVLNQKIKPNSPRMTMRDRFYEKLETEKKIITSLKTSPLKQITNMVPQSKKTNAKRQNNKIGDRNMQWKIAKENKIKKMKEQLRDKELEGCTFKPLRVTENSKLAQPYEKAVNNMNTIHYYYERNGERISNIS